MIFTSFAYLLGFLPIAAIVCLQLGRSNVATRWLNQKMSHQHAAILLILLGTSCYFYSTWNPKHLPLLLLSVLGNWLISRAICHCQTRRNARAVLIFGLAINIGTLGYFKYANFLMDMLRTLLPSMSLPQSSPTTLPLAISFFTFQQIAWLVDVYHKEAPRCTLLEYGCAVTFFPHLIAGPIVQYHDLIP